MHSLNSIKTTLIISIIFLMTACHNHKPQKITNSYDWQQVKSWSFNGKMAINDGQNSGSGRIKWNLTADKLEAQFKAPLGGGSWKIIETPDQAKLTSSKNGDVISKNAQTLISNELGWDFPWDKLSYWFRGFKSDDSLSVHQTTLKSLKDDGWMITYQKWIQTPIGLLPKKIKATKGNYSVKLFIYNWSINK